MGTPPISNGHPSTTTKSNASPTRAPPVANPSNGQCRSHARNGAKGQSPESNKTWSLPPQDELGTISLIRPTGQWPEPISADQAKAQDLQGWASRHLPGYRPPRVGIARLARLIILSPLLPRKNCAHHNSTSPLPYSLQRRPQQSEWRPTPSSGGQRQRWRCLQSNK